MSNASAATAVDLATYMDNSINDYKTNKQRTIHNKSKKTNHQNKHKISAAKVFVTALSINFH